MLSSGTVKFKGHHVPVSAHACCMLKDVKGRREHDQRPGSNQVSLWSILSFGPPRIVLCRASRSLHRIFCAAFPIGVDFAVHRKSEPLVKRLDMGIMWYNQHAVRGKVCCKSSRIHPILFGVQVPASHRESSSVNCMANYQGKSYSVSPLNPFTCRYFVQL